MTHKMSEKEKRQYDRMVEGAEQIQFDLDELTAPSVYGYARAAGRCAAGKNSLSEQKKQLKEAGAEMICADVYAESGEDMPELRHLAGTLRGEDTLVVTSLDRLGRSAPRVSSLLLTLLEKGVEIRVLDLGTLNRKTVPLIMLNTLRAFSRFDETARLERMLEGKETVRKQAGRREGRPKKYSALQMDHAMSLLQAYSYTQVEEMTGISRATLVREKKRRETPMDP